MKSKGIRFRTALAILMIAGLFVSFSMAHNPGAKKACCGTCGGAAKVAAKACCGSCGGAAKTAAKTCSGDAKTACSSASAVCTASAGAQQCPVSQFMMRLSQVDLTEAQIEKMLVIWKDTEKKLLGILTPIQLAKMKEPLPLQSQLAAQVAAQVSGKAKAACCGTCGGAAKTADQKACCGSCGGAQAKSCPAGCTKACCAK